MKGSLRNIPKEKKLTQDELSHYSRVDRSYINELENGEKAPSLLTITALSQLYHSYSVRSFYPLQDNKFRIYQVR